MSESPEKEEIDDKEKDGQHFKAGGIPGLHFLTCSFGLRPTQHIPFQLQQALQQYKKLSHEYILHNIPDRNCLTTDNTEPQVLSFTSRLVNEHALCNMSRKSASVVSIAPLNRGLMLEYGSLGNEVQY